MNILGTEWTETRGHVDRYGLLIKAGDMLYSREAHQYADVVCGEDGSLHLGRVGSRLEWYQPHALWEVLTEGDR